MVWPVSGITRVRKYSRTSRFIRFLSTARRSCFFAIASPSRDTATLLPSVAIAKTVKKQSDDRRAPAKTRENSLAVSNRYSREKARDSFWPSPAFPRQFEFSVTRFFRIAYGASRARPFARRALITLRPARVAIRARKP